MDHKVSKDMISSGMTPSGEKTQADLARTQYGSAPSPNSLFDAYKSMYEHHQKDKDGNTIPHENDIKEGKIPAGLQAFLDKKKGKKKDDGDEKKSKKGKGKPDFLDLDKDGDKKEPMKKASKEMKEGAGLYANIHAKRKRGGKMRKKGAKGAPSSQDFANAARTAKEDFEKYDLVYNHFISEGFSEEETYERMSNLTEEQLDEFLKALAQAGMRGAESIGKKTQGLAARAAQQGAMTDPKFRKLGKVQGPRPNRADQVLDDLRTRRKQQSDNLRGRLDTAVTQLRSKEGLKFGGSQSSTPTSTPTPTSKSKSTATPTPTPTSKSKSTATQTSSGNTTIKPQQKKNNLLSTDNMVKAQIATSMLSGGGGQQKKKTGQVSAESIRRSRGQVMQDSFDLISNELIKEGYSEKETYKIMSNLTEDQIEELNEAIISGTLATLGVLGKILGAGATKAAVAGKGLATAAKGAAIVAKKGVISTAQKTMTGTKDLANKALTKVKNIAKPPSKGPKITSSGGDIVQGSDQAKNKIMSTDNLMRGQMASNLLSGNQEKKQTAGTVSASADLFDIVKGQLLDEGLSEEEIRDIMTTLTPEEIMNEMNQGPSTPVKNYGDSPNKPKILPNFGATRAKVRTTEKGTVIKGGKDTGKTAAQLSNENV